jgi:hypothetical protein
MGRACGTYRGEEKCVQGFGGKTEGTETTKRSRLRWVDNIKMDVTEIGRESVD